MIDNVCVIIPAYNPDEELFLKFAKEVIVNFSKGKCQRTTRTAKKRITETPKTINLVEDEKNGTKPCSNK